MDLSGHTSFPDGFTRDEEDWEANVMISYTLISKAYERVKHIRAVFLVQLSYLFVSEQKMRNACMYEDWKKSCPEKNIQC